MARRNRTIRSWHRPLIVLASIVGLGVVGWLAYAFLLAGNSEARLLVSPLPGTETGGGFRMCNQTQSRVGVAIGYKDSSGWATEGWWNVNANACETLVKGPLVSRFYYVYAVDYDRGGTWGGMVAMCTRDASFTIHGIEDCVARGYERAGFFEVDTGEQKSWTVQLTAPGQPDASAGTDG
jgi:uncharacterized membrane protein